MPYAPFPIVEVAVADLRLDRQNYRIEESLPTESAAITYLFAEHNVTSLCRQILLEGYVDNELVLAVEETGEFVVLEGNRRVTALKALLDPSIAPAGARRDIENLLRRNEIEAEDLPTRIRVMLAPSRSDVQRLLARLHIGQSKSGWGRDEQARFVIAQLETGRSIATIRLELPGIKNATVYVRQFHVRKMLREATYEDPTVGEWAASSRLKMTAFEYAYGNSDIQDVLGLAFDKEGVPTSRPSTPEQFLALERLISMFKSNELNTRKFPKRTSPTYAEDMRRLVSRLRGSLEDPASDAMAAEGPVVPPQPDADALFDALESDKWQGLNAGGEAISPSGSAAEADGHQASLHQSNLPAASEDPGTDSANHASVSAAESSLPLPPGRGPNNPDTSSKVQIALDYRSTPTGLRKRFIELRSLDLGTHPISAALLIRSIIESSIKLHFAQRGEHVSGELGVVMVKVRECYSSERSQINAINLLSDKSGVNVRPGSLHWFNLATHDPSNPVSAQGVRDAWQSVEGFIRFMLIQPSAALQSEEPQP